MVKYKNPQNQSKGILDDFAVRKAIATREGTITKTPANDIDIANKKYVDDQINLVDVQDVYDADASLTNLNQAITHNIQNSGQNTGSYTMNLVDGGGVGWHVHYKLVLDGTTMLKVGSSDLEPVLHTVGWLPLADNTYDLGQGNGESARRWKDLYLAGTIKGSTAGSEEIIIDSSTGNITSLGIIKGALDADNNKIINVTDPTTNQDAATKKYVDDNDVNTQNVKGASITVEDPTSSEDITMFFTNVAITISEMRAVLVGSATPSVTWKIRHHATDRNNVGNAVVNAGTTTTSTTTGSDVTSFDDATIRADSFVWLETTAKSGTVTELHVTLVFTED